MSRADNPDWLDGIRYAVEYMETELGIDLSDTGLKEWCEIAEEYPPVKKEWTLTIDEKEANLICEALQLHPHRFLKGIKNDCWDIVQKIWDVVNQ